MAKIEYHDIAQEIASILLAEPVLSMATVTVEENHLFGMEKTPWVNIKLTRRDALDSDQPIAAGTVLRYRVLFTLDCWENHLEGPTKAAEFRDDLVGKVETTLMGNRSLNGKAIQSWITGGAFLQTEDDPNVRGAEINLVVDAKATT